MVEPLALPFSLPPPRDGGCDLLVVAGEHSGDQHAARAVTELRALRPDVRVCALGGPALAAAGVQVLHDLTASSVVGLVEVLRNYRFFRALFGAAVDWIAQHRPRAVCLVDYPGFNLRLAARLRELGLSRHGGGTLPVVYYISPQIWAWKGGRRFAMARTLDAMAVIFPFEVQSYADTTLPVEFVGHPFVGGEEPETVRHDPAGPVLLLPGSRRQAVNRIFPVLLDGYARWRAEGGDRPAVVISPSAVVDAVLERHLSTRRNLQPWIRRARPGDVVDAGAVLTSSGTMSLRCALAGIPGAIAYRANPLTYLIGRQVVRVPWLGIANLLLGEPMYPEFIQGAARAGALAGQIRDCLVNQERRERTADQARRMRALLAHPPSITVGGWLGRFLG